MNLHLRTATPGETSVLFVHAPYPGKLRFKGPPSSLLSAAAPFARAVAEGGVEGNPVLGVLDPGESSEGFYGTLRRVARGGTVRAVCISTSTAAIEETARIVRVVREAAGEEVLVVVGGPHEDDVEEKVATRVEGVNLSIAGDAEYVLDFVLREWLARNEGTETFTRALPRRLAGASVHAGVGEVSGPWVGSLPFDFGSPGAEELSLPRPWTGQTVPFEVFDAPETLPLMVSRGCPYGKCTFCAEGVPGRSRLVAAEFSWVERLIETHPKAAFYFQDSIFPSTPPVRKMLIPMLKASGVEWGCQVYLRSLTRRMLGELADGGCRYLYTGVESGSTEVLSASGKVNMDRKVVLERVGWIAEHQMRLGVSLMFGVMDLDGRLVETEKSIEETVALCEEIARRADVRGFYPNVQTVLPGTSLARGINKSYDLDFYRMPRSEVFEGLEEGSVGYNFVTLRAGRDDGREALVGAVRRAAAAGSLIARANEACSTATRTGGG